MLAARSTARAQGHCATDACTCLQGNQQPQQVQGQGPFAKNKHSSCSLPLGHAPELGQAAAPHQGSPKRTPAFIYNTPQVTYHGKERVQYNSRTQQRKDIGSSKSLQPSPQLLVLGRPGSPIPASSKHRRAGGCHPCPRSSPAAQVGEVDTVTLSGSGKDKGTIHAVPGASGLRKRPWCVLPATATQGELRGQVSSKGAYLENGVSTKLQRCQGKELLSLAPCSPMAAPRATASCGAAGGPGPSEHLSEAWGWC